MFRAGKSIVDLLKEIQWEFDLSGPKYRDYGCRPRIEEEGQGFQRDSRS